MKVTRCEKSKLDYIISVLPASIIKLFCLFSRQYLKQKEEEDEERKRLESKYRDRVIISVLHSDIEQNHFFSLFLHSFHVKARERRDGRIEDNDAEDAAKMSSEYRAVAPTETEYASFYFYLLFNQQYHFTISVIT